MAAGDPGRPTIQRLLDEANMTMGEKIEIRRFARFDSGSVYVYRHKHDPALPPVSALWSSSIRQ